MSWLRWACDIVLLFAFSILWIGALAFLIDKMGRTLKDLLEFWLTRKKAVLEELEKELDRRVSRSHLN